MATEFRFEIGDIVGHVLNPMLRGVVLERHTLETMAGKELRYLVRVNTDSDEVSANFMRCMEFEVCAHNPAPEPRR